MFELQEEVYDKYIKPNKYVLALISEEMDNESLDKFFASFNAENMENSPAKNLTV